MDLVNALMHRFPKDNHHVNQEAIYEYIKQYRDECESVRLIFIQSSP